MDGSRQLFVNFIVHSELEHSWSQMPKMAKPLMPQPQGAGRPVLEMRANPFRKSEPHK